MLNRSEVLIRDKKNSESFEWQLKSKNHQWISPSEVFFLQPCAQPDHHDMAASTVTGLESNKGRISLSQFSLIKSQGLSP